MKKIYRKSPWNRAVTAIACMLVFITTYMLILPAITLTRDPVCGLEEHTHTEACYTVDYVPVLDCPFTANEGNVIYIHTHDQNCFDADGNLVCTLPEREEHVHTAACYPNRT